MSNIQLLLLISNQKPNNMNDNFLVSSDLALVAALCTLGHKLNAIDKNNKKVFFSFERTTDLETDVSKFWNHELNIDPLRYFNCLKEIKTRIYSF